MKTLLTAMACLALASSLGPEVEARGIQVVVNPFAFLAPPPVVYQPPYYAPPVVYVGGGGWGGDGRHERRGGHGGRGGGDRHGHR